MEKGREGSVVGRRNPHGPYGIVGERIVWASAPASGFEPGPPATGAGVLPLHQRAVGRASPNRRMPPSIRMVRGGPGAPGPASHHGCLSWCDGEARPPRGCDGTHRPAPPRSPVSDGNTRGATPSVSLRDSTDDRGQPRECGECIVCRHPGGLGQEPHAATQGTPPTAGWVSCPIPRTRWGVDGRADGMGTARLRIRCAGCASYSVPEPSASRPHE